jgi:multiple sugar transport system ATP-binding protein
MAKVELQGVTKRFGAVTAVDNLNLEVDDGEFLILLGPSGCGKTTALRLIAGLEELTAGKIYIGDHLVNDVATKDRDIAMVFQSYALYPHMSARDNMGFGLKMRHIPKTEIATRVEHVAQMLGIETLLGRKPRQLSGGQRQRVALGRAIVREPAVFLMDEPLSNLDAKLRVQTRAELIRLHQRLQRTVIYVTHDQVEAMTMGTRIVLLKDGLVQQMASPTVLYDQPANVFVAGFLGSPSMNFFPAELVEDGGDLFAQATGIQVKFTAEQAGRLRNASGRSVIVGVRPEDVDCTGACSGANGTPHFNAAVDVVEELGSEKLVYFFLDGKSIIARLGGDVSPRPGDKVEIGLRLEKLHVFDATTEVALI